MDVHAQVYEKLQGGALTSVEFRGKKIKSALALFNLVFFNKPFLSMIPPMLAS